MQPPEATFPCLRLAQCRLDVATWQWPLAKAHAAAIGDDWLRRLASNPGLFDGTIYLLRDYAIDGEVMSGTLFRTDFKSFLYWRAHDPAGSDGVRECFGASLIRSAEGHVLLGRQAPGQLNSGRIYPPSGLIDSDDVIGGKVDIDASIARELREETGLTPETLQRWPGYLAARVGTQVAVAVEWRSRLPADELRGSILEFLGGEARPELDDIVIVRRRDDIDPALMPPHACTLLHTVLPA
jgi:8-oxo-dGTP pyrophosphatase MutT (NUDIX family)